GKTQTAQSIDQRPNGVSLAQANEERAKGFRLGHEPEGEPRHDTDVGLCEEPVQCRPTAMRIEMSRLCVRKSAEASLEQLPIRQDQSESARMGKSIAVRTQADAALEDIAQDAGVRTGAGGVHPQWDLVLFQVFEELSLRDTRFDNGICQLGVDLDD